MLKEICLTIILLACYLVTNECKSVSSPKASTVDDDSCHTSTKYKFMSSKTSYVLVANTGAKKEYQMPKCKQVGIWHTLRHGQRYPEDVDINDINDNLIKFKNKILNESTGTWLCERDLQALKAWSPKMQSENGYYLTANGILYMKQLGARMRNRLGDLMAKLRANPGRVRVKATNITRTIQSSEAYLDGMYASWSNRPTLTTQNDATDFLLKFPDICDKYLTEIDGNPMACTDTSQFDLSSTEFNKEITAFGNRFGLPLFPSERKRLFDLALKACQYEYLVDGTDSIWCKFFPQSLLRLIEYREDLKYYCKYGYKYNISRDMTCDLVSDLVSSLKELKSQNPTTLASLYFTHSSTMLPLLASMGLYNKETDFDFDSVKNINENRSYRTSRIDPMNSNLAFVVYKCDQTGQKSGGSDSSSSSSSSEETVVSRAGPVFKLRVFHNENLVKTDGCSSSKNCDLDEFISFHEKFTNRCGSAQSVCTL